MTIPTIPLAGSLTRYVQSLSTGDRYVALTLAVIVGITSLMSAYSLEKHFLVQVPAFGGSINEGVVGAPRFINPLLAISDTDHDLTALTHAGLMGRKANGVLIPVLASRYALSPDGLTYSFTLRNTAKFSDGTPVTAEDVVYTIQKAQDPLLKSPVRANWVNIRAEVVDSQTVKFTLPKPYAGFVQNATLGILPAHIWRNTSDEEFPFSPYTTAPVGAGPYVVSAVSRSATGMVTGYTLSAFDGYVLGKPYISQIQFSVFADTVALTQALGTHSIDSAYGVPAKDAVSIPYAEVLGVFFNPVHDAIFNDVTVRKALSQAIDRPALVKNVLGEYAMPAYGPLPGMAGSNAVANSTASNTTNGAELARQTLSTAGWKFSSSTNRWIKSGQSLSVTLTTSNVPELKAIAMEIQRDWQAIGVPVTLDFVSPSDISQTVIRPRAFGALLFGEVTGADPDLYAFWDSSQRADPGLNIAAFSDPAVDALLQKARTETDPAQRYASEQSASQLIANQYPAAFTHTPDFIYALPSNLSGTAFQSAVTRPADRFNGVQDWYLQSELVWPLFATRR